MTGETRIWLHDAPPGLIGHALAVATPQDTFDNRWNVGAIVDVGIDNHPTEGPKGFIDVLDPDELIASALAENECGFVVYDHHDTNIGASAHHTFGAWTDAPAHDSGFTTFTDGAAGGAIKDFMVGWLLVPDVHQLAYLEIVAVADGEITVKGNAENMAADGTQYWLIAPAGVSATTGATETNPKKMPNPWLWAGYHYLPPIAGFKDPQGQDPGTYGKQPGPNQAGQYDCWNRVYEPSTGRWTTPDPAMSPWTNLHGYASSGPVAFTDPSGLAGPAAAAAATYVAVGCMHGIAAALLTRLITEPCSDLCKWAVDAMIGCVVGAVGGPVGLGGKYGKAAVVEALKSAGFSAASFGASLAIVDSVCAKEKNKGCEPPKGYWHPTKLGEFPQFQWYDYALQALTLHTSTSPDAPPPVEAPPPTTPKAGPVTSDVGTNPDCKKAKALHAEYILCKAKLMTELDDCVDGKPWYRHEKSWESDCRSKYNNSMKHCTDTYWEPYLAYAKKCKDKTGKVPVSDGKENDPAGVKTLPTWAGG